MNKAMFFLLGLIIGMDSKEKINLDDSTVILIKIILVLIAIYVIIGGVIHFLKARKKQFKLKVKKNRGW